MITVTKTAIPILIIHPKLMTGNNPEKTKDEKPAIVVITVKKHGFNMELTVFITKSF